MNAFQTCQNTSDAIPLYLPQQLYLKPCATISISVQLPVKMMGKTIIHGEIIKKLRSLITPDDFSDIKVTKTTVDVVRFEAQLELKAYIPRVLSKLDHKLIKLKDITQLMKVKACEAKSDFPSRHEWDAYFRDAKDMNEMKVGERPDTVHISNLPTSWFIGKGTQVSNEDLLPSEKLFYHVFEKFGPIRQVDIPICDPYRSKMKAHISGIQTSSFADTQFFEGYIQFKDYLGFVECMDALRGMKLMRNVKGEALIIKIFVTFDKSKHLSEGVIRRRDILRERLIIKQRTQEDKEKLVQKEKEQTESAEKQKNDNINNAKQQRRHAREENRKKKILEQLKGKGSDDLTAKIAKEEKKLLVVQRRLEAIRLVENLFKRLESKLDLSPKEEKRNYDGNANQLTRMRMDYEHEFSTQREKLHKAVEGRVILRSIVSSTVKEVCSENNTSSDDDSIGDPQRDAGKLYPSHPLNAVTDWYPYWQNPLMAAYGTVPPPFYGAPPQTRGYYFPARGGSRAFAGPSGPRRSFHARGRGQGRGGYNHRNAPQHWRNWKSRSRSRSRSKYRSRSVSVSRSKSRSRSRRRHDSSRSYSRSRSRSRSRYKSRSRSHRRSRTPSDIRQVTTTTRSKSCTMRSRSGSRSHSRSSNRKS